MFISGHPLGISYANESIVCVKYLLGYTMRYYNTIMHLFCFLNTFECDVIHMENILLSKIKALKYNQSKIARRTHGPPKYYHAPSLGYAPGTGSHGASVTASLAKAPDASKHSDSRILK